MKRGRTILRAIANAFWLSLLISFYTLTPCSGERYWNGLVNYDPPIPMWGGPEAGNAGLPISGYELRSEGTTNGFAQVTFQISSIVVLFKRPSEIPKTEIKTADALKELIDSRMQNDARA